MMKSSPFSGAAASIDIQYMMQCDEPLIIYILKVNIQMVSSFGAAMNLIKKNWDFPFTTHLTFLLSSISQDQLKDNKR